MGDLIHRLRAPDGGVVANTQIISAARQAADEIERLRGALTVCANHADDMPLVVKTAVEALIQSEGEWQPPTPRSNNPPSLAS